MRIRTCKKCGNREMLDILDTEQGKIASDLIEQLRKIVDETKQALGYESACADLTSMLDDWDVAVGKKYRGHRVVKF